MSISPTVKVVRRKHKDVSQLGKNLARGPNRVKVGFPTGGEITTIAGWMEFGNAGGASGGGWGGPIPARPFVRTAISEGEGQIKSTLKSEAKGLLMGGASPGAVMTRLGVLGQNLIRGQIPFPGVPNSPVTIALKGSSAPLMDTGSLRGAVTYEVQ